MTARACFRSTIGLLAAYALALQAIFGLSLTAAAQAAPDPAAILCAAHADAGGTDAPATDSRHDCALACMKGGCGAPSAGIEPASNALRFEPGRAGPRPAIATLASRHASGTPHGARSPPHASPPSHLAS